MSDAITLHPCNIIDVASLEGPADYQAMANNQDILSGLDDLVHSWCKQIEQVFLKLCNLYFLLYIRLNLKNLIGREHSINSQ